MITATTRVSTVDRIDETILGLLRDDARRSFSSLGREIGLSTNAVAARVRRLESAGVIVGYTVVTAAEPRDRRPGLEVFIDVRLAPGHDHTSFTGAIAPIREIVDAIHVTGPYDYLVPARVPDTAALDALLRRLKKDCGVAQTQTRIALR